MTFWKKFKQNISESGYSVSTEVSSLKLIPIDSNVLVSHLKLLIPYFCNNPLLWLSEIEQYEIGGIDPVLKKICSELQKNPLVWKGTIGEVLATAYAHSFTDYEIPVYKLRFPHNRTLPLHGDDLLGFKFDENNNPQELLVVEAKNYKDPSAAIKLANETLLKVKKYGPTLITFIVNIIVLTDPQKAIIINRFQDRYNNKYSKKYLAFIVTDKENWKDEHFNKVSNNPASPLTVVSFLVPDWEKCQECIPLSEKPKTPSSKKLPLVVEEKEMERLFGNPSFQLDQKYLASAALASSLKIDKRETINYKYDRDKMIAAAQFISFCSLNSKEIDMPYLAESANIYERISIIELENRKIKEATDNIILGSISYNLAGYHANAKVLLDCINNFSEGELKVDFIYNCYQLLASGKINELQDILAAFFIKKEKGEPNNSIDYVIDELGYYCDKIIANLFSSIIKYLKTGNNDFLKNNKQYLESIREYYLILGDYEKYNFVYLLDKYLTYLILNSTQNLISKEIFVDYEWQTYLRLISTTGKYPMTTLWQSQKEILSSGILNNQFSLLALPTSAGKTKITELAAFNAIKDTPDGICVYVAPTRALAVEVENSLASSLMRMGISVAILYGGYELTPIEEEIIASNKVFVVTPEKLDLILRSKKDFIEKIQLIIVDEIHECATSSKRSLRQELIYSRLFYLAKKNSIKIICLSAVLTNVKDFSRWIFGDEDKAVISTWRPTRQRFGYFSWFNDSATVRYKNEEHLDENFFVPLLFQRNDLIIKDDKIGLEIAARLGEYYSKNGTTLIFTNTKILVDKISDILILIKSANTKKLSIEAENLVNECISILGEDHKIIKCLRLGFCYHHASLPANVKKIIEKGIRKNIIPLIVSTTTLAQGVNLPIRNVIIHSIPFINKISSTDYKNIIGRAGRAGMETEGHIVFCSQRMFVELNQADESSESFIFSGLKSLSKGRFPSIEDTTLLLNRWSLFSTDYIRKKLDSKKPIKRTKRGKEIMLSQREEIIEAIDSQILSWIDIYQLDEILQNEINEILDNTLCKIQCSDIQELFDCFKKSVIVRSIDMHKKLMEIPERDIFKTTGFGYQSNIEISKYAKIVSEKISDWESLEKVPEIFWKETYELFSKLREFDKIPKINQEVVIEWIRGSNYKAIAQKYFEGNIEKAVKDIETVTYLLPWGLNALIKFIKYYSAEKELPIIIEYLPGLMSRGVPDLPAYYSLCFGISERDVAIKLGEAYSITNINFGYINIRTDFKNWINGLSFEDFTLIFMLDDIENDRLKIYFEKLRNNLKCEPINRSVEFNFDDCEGAYNIGIENLFIIKCEDDFYVSSLNNLYQKKLSGPNIAVLNSIDRSEKDIIITNIDPVADIMTLTIY